MSSLKSRGMMEVRWLDSIGSEAVFSTRDVRQGTRIAAEIPLIVVPPVPREKELSTFCNEIYKTPQDNVTKISELPCRRLVKERIRKDHCMNQEVWGFLKARKWRDHADIVLKGKKLHKAIKTIMNLCTIFQTNSLSLGPEGIYGSGLFYLYSRINHSCVPNAHASYNPTLKRLTIHAIHNIKAGDQILVNYIGDALAAYECGASKEPNFSTTHGVPKVTTAAEALKIAEELSHLLTMQGLHGMELCRTLHECSKYALDSGDPERALTYAHEELDLEKALIGTETSHLEDNLQGAKYWVGYVQRKLGERA
ncbi:hypothetical protein Hte_000552 [Hypoxylon texense]